MDKSLPKSQQKRSQLMSQFRHTDSDPLPLVEREPPASLTDRVPHTMTDHVTMESAWHLVGASRRGKAHAYKARFRDDAFALGYVEQWHFMVVADGGGSCPLARVGSHIAAKTAVRVMQAEVSAATPGTPPALIAETALRQGLIEAWEALDREAQQRHINIRDLGTTFLCLIHTPLEEGSLIGVVQVGDGLLAAQVSNEKTLVLVEPDSGADLGSTLFLTSFHWREWITRVSVGTLPVRPQMLLAMTDGVSNDFMPFKQYLPTLFQYLTELTNSQHPAQDLLTMLGYDKANSYDDRTIAMLYQQL